jgi:hypothetical protein
MTTHDGSAAVRWVRPALVILAVPNLFAGVWGLIAPENWYENFPGWAPRLVAAIPPYNEHLATDAAAGLFASGVAAAIGAWWMRREIVIVAMAVYLAFAFPHAAFHLANPADALSTSEDTVNVVSLLFAVAIALAVMIESIRATPRQGATS